MKSIKPGRGPSGISFVGSIGGIIFGVLWTILASSMTAGAGVIGLIFPLFGIFFIIMGILNAVYNYKNATGKDRFSAFDITDSTEEDDPASKWIKREQNRNSEPESADIDEYHFCPYCGAGLKRDFEFCPKCGKGIKE